MMVTPPEETPDIRDWYFVWDWWPVPRFLLSLLGADGCCEFVEGLGKYRLDSRLLVSFALAIEHSQQPIISQTDLRKCIAKICGREYDFSSAKSLERSVSVARWATLLAKENEAEAATWLPTKGAEAASYETTKESLPSGRSENIALMRAILARRSDHSV